MSGNITSIINGAEKGAKNGAKNSVENNSQNTTSPTSATMEYDQNNRLTKYNGQAVKYDVSELEVLVCSNRYSKRCISRDNRRHSLGMTSNRRVTTWYKYENGRLTEVTDPMENVTKYTYDSMNRVKTVINALGEKTGYTYNAEGLLEEETNGRGRNATTPTPTMTREELWKPRTKQAPSATPTIYTMRIVC